MYRIDRKTFFNAIRLNPFPGTLTAAQVRGMEFILDVWEKAYTERTSIPQLSYCLATTYHETAATMQPIEEYGRGKGRRYGVKDKITGQIYYGRGFVQLTWLFNYDKAGKKLGIDLVNKPHLALDPMNAALIMFEGMEEGWFTTKTLDGAIDDEINGNEHKQYIYARRIINGTDKAELIARVASAFEKALLKALIDAPADIPIMLPHETVPEPVVKPNKEIEKPKKRKGLFSRLLSAIFS